MDSLRALLAIAVFSLSTYLVIDLLRNGFNLVVLLVCLGGFVLAHFLWPRKSNDGSAWYDWFEIIIDIPNRSIALILRSIGRSTRSGTDFDFD